MLSNYFRTQKQRRDEAVLRDRELDAEGKLRANAYVRLPTGNVTWVEKGKSLPPGGKVVYRYGG